MSKYVQIDVRLTAYYGHGGLRGVLPNLHNFLKFHRYDLVVEKGPSLYEMVEVLVRIGNDPHVPQTAKRPITGRLGEFVKVRDEARDLLLSRRLNELDAVLYRLEDLFADLDANLA